MPTFISKQFLAKSGITLIIGIVLVAAIIFQTAELKNRISNAQASWSAFNEHAAPLNGHLADLNQALGYGGFIHHFKNYVLRRDQTYATQASQSLSQAREALQSLEKALKSGTTTSGAVGEIWAIRQTMNAYREKFNAALQQPKDMSPQALDDTVRIDDGPALAALNDLTQRIKTEFDQRRADSERHITKIKNEIHIENTIATLVLIATGMAIWLLRRMERMNGQILAAKSQLDLLIDDAPEAMLFISEDGIIQRCNTEAVTLFEYAQPELVGMCIEELLPPETRERHVQHRVVFQDTTGRRLMGEGAELQAITKSGRLIYVEISLNHSEFDGKKLTIAAIRDVSMQRKVARELSDARAAAENANEMKSAFLANMSHEIRTPLTGLLGMAELLEMTDLDDKQTDFIRTLKKSGRHLETVLNDILDLSKLEADRMELSVEPFDIVQLTDTVRSVYGAIATAKQIELKFQIVGDLENREIYGDVVRLRQVVMNLVGNAVKFTQAGGVEVIMSLHRNPTDRMDTLRIVVHDSGIGIPEDALSKIFDPFTQITHKRTRNNSGTGLGLSICRRMIKKMNGSITVKSTLDEGSTFTVNIPLKTAVVTHKPAPQASATAPKLRLVAPRKMRILVADDNETNRRLVDAMTKSWGYEVEFACDGAEAMAKIKAQAYDVILLDIHMPKMDGREIMVRAKSAGCIKGRVYAFTADVMTKSIDEYHMQGFDGYVSKPVDWESLHNLLKGEAPTDTRNTSVAVFTAKRAQSGAKLT
tara:strand:- start:2932 stop:5220 length:2289 start_codon:yes stop_codon:yes gene_type:complete